MTPEKHISLAELLANVKQSLTERFPFGIWISAELGEVKLNRYSGHCYLELIEKGDKDGTPKAKASAAIWRSRWGLISQQFIQATGTQLAAGMQVLLKVNVSFHEAYGFSLVVSDIDPTFTLGEGERRKRETLAALQANGLLELNRALPFPLVPQRVAVISSATAAGLQDFCNHIADSPYRIELTLFEAIVQGNGAESSIIEALDEVAARAANYDLVVIIRGGGSQSDLECFNSYPLASHVAQFPLPVVAGIGHDKDYSVVDHVAACSLKTPTAVADFLVARAEGYHNEVENIYSQIGVLVSHHLIAAGSQLQLLGAALASTSSTRITDSNMRLERASFSLRHSTQRHLEAATSFLERTSLSLNHSALRLIESAHNRLAVAESTVKSSSPERILSMGFAVVRSGGKALLDVSSLSEGQEIDITLAHGRAQATITSKSTK